MAAGMPFSNLMMSQGQFIIAGTWLLSGIAHNDIPTKLKAYFTNKQALALAAVYFALLIGMLHTANLNYGLKDLRIKLPLFLLPFMLTGLGILKEKEYRIVIIVFIAALIASSITGFVLYQTGAETLAEPRKLSPFISNVRFSLLIVVGVFMAGWLANSYKKRNVALAAVLAIIWLLYFMLRLESVTGFALLFISAIVAALMYNNRMGKILRVAVPIVLLVFAIASVWFVKNEYAAFFSAKPENTSSTSINGNAYGDANEFPFYENGSYMGADISRKELEQEWPKRSAIAINGLDAKKQPIYFTLLRYITSKHLSKDSLGIAKLNDADIKNIESGIASVIYVADEGLNSRLHKIFWEYQLYKTYNNPSGHSLSMRLEFWEAALSIIKKQPLTGVGTGDVGDAFTSHYIETNSRLNEGWRLRAHNQFLAIGVALGIIGIIILLFSILYPFIASHGYESVVFTAFFITAFLSMFTEDTLETQAGVSFYIFFYCLFLFLKPISTQPMTNELLGQAKKPTR